MKFISFVGGFIVALATLTFLSIKSIITFIKNPELKSVFKFANIGYKLTFLAFVANIMYSFSPNDHSWTPILNTLLFCLFVLSVFITVKPVPKKLHDKFMQIKGIDIVTFNKHLESIPERPQSVTSKMKVKLEKKRKEKNIEIPTFTPNPMMFYIGVYNEIKLKTKA